MKTDKSISLSKAVQAVNAVAKAEAPAKAAKAEAPAKAAKAEAPAKAAKAKATAKSKVNKIDQMTQALTVYTVQSLNTLAASFTAGRKECPPMARWTDLVEFCKAGCNGHAGLAKNWPIILAGWVTGKGYHVRKSSGFKTNPENGIPGLFHDNETQAQASEVYLVRNSVK